MFDITEKGDLEGLVAHYHDDAVIDYPRSGERIEGRQNALAVYSHFPEGSPKFTVRELRASGDLVVAEHGGEYPEHMIMPITVGFSRSKHSGERSMHVNQVLIGPVSSADFRHPQGARLLASAQPIVESQRSARQHQGLVCSLGADPRYQAG